MSDEKQRLSDEPSARTECPYCKRPVDERGGINHEPKCTGLEKIEINRLQYDALRRSETINEPAQPPFQGCTECGSPWPDAHKGDCKIATGMKQAPTLPPSAGCSIHGECPICMAERALGDPRVGVTGP